MKNILLVMLAGTMIASPSLALAKKLTHAEIIAAEKLKLPRRPQPTNTNGKNLLPNPSNVTNKGFKDPIVVNGSSVTRIAPYDALITVISCFDCTLQGYVDGSRQVLVHERDKYGTGKIGSTMTVKKGESWHFTGAESMTIRYIEF